MAKEGQQRKFHSRFKRSCILSVMSFCVSAPVLADDAELQLQTFNISELALAADDQGRAKSDITLGASAWTIALNRGVQVFTNSSFSNQADKLKAGLQLRRENNGIVLRYRF